ncbi:response regulator [Caballeronia sp. LZ032]|uniref:response regulator n=1 Tax=Caballeronia sp. LZ032 TaxID=3038565 RepID=UPI002863D362|nr:response regulator [Caballeronia sp. LZ032]MDR5884226.1 response regulator [Caballeronia sp. LZ032]
MVTILLVDDEPSTLEGLQATLPQHYNVLTAENGEVGLALACSRLPDLIVTDRDMPTMDGVRLCEELDRYPASRQIPVIMMSGHAWCGALPAPWSVFLLKPVDPVALQSAIRSLVRQRCGNQSGGVLPRSPDRARRWAPIHKKLPL